MKTIKAIEFEDYGVDNCQYIQVPTRTNFSGHILGCGMNEKEAINDAINQLFESFDDIQLSNELKESLTEVCNNASELIPKILQENNVNEDLYYYVALHYLIN